MEQMELFPLSEDELKTRSKTLAAAIQRYNQREREAKETAQAATKELKALRREMTQLSDEVTHEKAWRVYTPPWEPGGRDDA